MCASFLASWLLWTEQVGRNRRCWGVYCLEVGSGLGGIMSFWKRGLDGM